MSRLVKIDKGGGLANRLFPFAHLLAHAAEHDHELIHLGFDEFADVFEGTRRGVRLRPKRNRVGPAPFAFKLRQRLRRKLGFAKTLHLGVDERCDLSVREVADRIRRSNSAQLSGLYFCDNDAIETHRELILQFFRPKPAIRKNIEDCMTAARSRGTVVVGVHIRQGDYREFADGLLFYETSEYCELMQKFEASVCRNAHFLVCSNELQHRSEFGTLSVSHGPNSVVGDLYALAACDYLIGPGSTFSEWASFYGRVPRYVHRRKTLERMGVHVPSLSAGSFRVHRVGFGRCAPDHPSRASLRNVAPKI